jgi:hypothetical protein
MQPGAGGPAHQPTQVVSAASGAGGPAQAGAGARQPANGAAAKSEDEDWWTE